MEADTQLRQGPPDEDGIERCHPSCPNAVDHRQRIRDCEPDFTPHDALCGRIVVNATIESVEAHSRLAGGKAVASRAIPFVFVAVVCATRRPAPRNRRNRR
ncbi:hypothetical protein [Burkholderia sp. NLJ2]|uniref:hypothetical protein n=1 Tax=Burkholderia sp. NLJ2 TaxID=3090699 RepID=UPI003C6C8902